jgi:hypothetical protein
MISKLLDGAFSNSGQGFPDPPCNLVTFLTILTQIMRWRGGTRSRLFTRMVSPDKVKSVTMLKGYKGLKSEAEWNS